MMTSLLGVLVLFHLFYFTAVIKKDFSIIDIAWALSFVVIISTAGLPSLLSWQIREYILFSVIIIWAVRLSGYILLRSIKVGREDYRYAAWRAEWGKKANIIAYFKVYLLQAGLALIIGSPLILFFHGVLKNDFGTWGDYLGLILWLFGFIFEAVSDYQKHQFKAQEENKGKILQTGLWKYSRHPNYFGEALLWWGIFFIVIQRAHMSYAWIGPFVLTFFLLKVSGVALLEKKYDSNNEYDAYKLRTNAFIPWFPKVKVK